jgi:predicted NBD/HSP70 family sugar kinase
MKVMANHSFVKNLNERRILTLLRVEGALTRAEVARRLRFNRSTVTNLVNGLLERNLVAETDKPSCQADAGSDLGRPGVNIALNPSGCYFLGVEIGVEVIRYVLMNMALSVVEQESIAIAPPHTPERVARQIATQLDKYQKNPHYGSLIQSVCVTVPGLVRNDGLVTNLVIVGWRDVDFRGTLSRMLPIPVQIENDANAAAFGEVYCHPKALLGMTVFLKLGIGCGGAVILDGRILKGHDGFGGDFGHMRIVDEGPICNCGRAGCMEPLVSMKALRTYLHDATLPADPSAEEIARAAALGNPSALAAARHLEHYLSLGMISLTNIFNPANIIIGGEMREIAGVVLDNIRSSVKSEIIPGLPAPGIHLSENGDFECAIGAAAIAHQQEFDQASVGLA